MTLQKVRPLSDHQTKGFMASKWTAATDDMGMITTYANLAFGIQVLSENCLTSESLGHI